MAATWCATTPSSVPEGREAWAFDRRYASGQWFLQGWFRMITPPYCRTALPVGFQLPARASTADGLVPACGLTRLLSLRHHRRMLAGWRRCGRMKRPRRMACPRSIGAEFRVHQGPKLGPALRGPARVCSAVPADHGDSPATRAEKASYVPLLSDFPTCRTDFSVCGSHIPLTTQTAPSWLQARFADRLWLTVQRHREPGESERVAWLTSSPSEHDLPLVASRRCPHAYARRPLQDVLTAIRHHCTVADAGWRLFPEWRGRHLRPTTDTSQTPSPRMASESVRAGVASSLARHFVTPIHGSFPMARPPPVGCAISPGGAGWPGQRPH